jgi:class 3 adenylate cyclase
MALPTASPQVPPPQYMRQLRLFLEEICCEICRFRHVEDDKVPPDAVQVSREVDLGTQGAFADILVEPAGLPPYAVEVKYGYPVDRMVQHLARKYSAKSAALDGGSRLVLVVDTRTIEDWERRAAEIRGAIAPELSLEIWDEARLLELIRDCFGVTIPAISVETLQELRFVIDSAKWRYAFDGKWEDNPLKSSLLWHFGIWRLRQLHLQRGLGPDEILPPGRYRGAVILLADLASFSSFVRDTRDDEVVRTALTTFYSNSRYAIMNSGGMMCHFVGDEVVALFGVPHADDGYAQRALECARALVQIGNSVANKWQREIDRVQSSGGVHIGMALGDVEVVSLRPFCRAHIGVIGDSINMAARLMGHAQAGELVASNTYFQSLSEPDQRSFEELEPIDAKNIGRIKAWKLRVGGNGRSRGVEATVS